MSFPFDKFCQALQSIKNRKDKEFKQRKLIELVTKWRQLCGNDVFPLLRLLLPQMDSVREMYGIKEQKMASIYCKILGVDPKSDEATTMVQWKKPKEGMYSKAYADTRQFIMRLQDVLQKRMPSSNPTTTMSIAEVNEKLDQLAKGRSIEEFENVFRYFYGHATLEEQIWLVRIILRDIEVGMSEKSILPCFHPDGLAFYQVNTNLQSLCEELLNHPEKKMDQCTVSVFQPFCPMLSNRCDTPDAIPDIMKNEEFWIETKLDGERIQLHMDNGVFKWFSRNSHDYTYLYGSSKEEGSMSPFIYDKFKKGITSCILDGEMVVYNTLTKSFEPFGALKTAANDINTNQASNIHPCYFVFDLLLLNGKSVTEIPLNKRYQWLSKLFVGNDTTRFQVLDHDIAKSSQDILANLEERMKRNEEGLIIKRPNSLYKANKSDDWLKVKPEYLKGLQEDVDLGVVGAYYGTKGELASFLCAVKNDQFSEGKRFISFCKFALNQASKPLEQAFLQENGNWEKFDAKKPPPFLDLPVSKDWPDLIVKDPNVAEIAQVRGAQMIVSESFPTGITVRFPRCTGVRTNEKPIQDIMTKTELRETFERKQGSMQAQEMIQVKAHVSKKVKSTHSSTTQRLDPKQIVVKENLFQGLEFCVFCKAIPDKDFKSKMEIEKMIIEYGGSITQAPGEETSMIIGDQLSVRINNQKGKYDIVYSSYIVDCIRLHEKIPLTPKYCLQATFSTSQQFRKFVDAYGDSFTEATNVDNLKSIFSQMKLATNLGFALWSPGPALNQRLYMKSQISELAYEFPNLPGQVFAQCNFYIAGDEMLCIANEVGVSPSESDIWTSSRSLQLSDVGIKSQLLISKIRLNGGTVVDRIDNATTHVLSGTSDVFFKVKNLLSNSSISSHFYVVNVEWIEACSSANSLVDENLFAFGFPQSI